MANKNSFVLQTRLNAVVAKLSDKQAGVLFKSILNYAANGAVANFEDSAVDIVFEVVRQDIDYTSAKYEDVCQKRKEAIKKRWAEKQKNTKNTNVYKCIQNDTKAYKRIHNDDDVDNDVDVNTSLKASDNINPPNIAPLKGGKFTKPTVEQVASYCNERNNGINAQQFVDFYASKGWKVGNTPMKDWQAAVRNWERRDKQERIEHVGTDYNRNPEPNKYAGFGRKISADE